MALSAELAQALERCDESRRELQAMLIIVEGVVTLLQSELKEQPAPEAATPRRPSWWTFWGRGRCEGDS